MQNVPPSRPDKTRSARRSRFRTVKLSRLSVNRFILSAAFAAFIPQVATAASLVWNADNAVGDPVGGTGVWDTAATSWDNAGAMQAWNNGGNDTAIFGGIAGTVTLGTPVTAGRLIFNTTGYTIAGGSNTLTLGGAAPGVTTTAAGVSATILANVNLTAHSVFGGAGDLIFTNGAISGGFGITKTGTGSLTLGGANTFSGPVAIRGGVVSIDAPGNLGDGSATNTLTLAAGGTLRTNGTFNLGSTRGPILQAGGGGFDVQSGNLTVDGNFSVNTGVGTNVEPLIKSGAGTLTLTGTNNTAAVHTYLDGGALSFATSTNLGTGNITFNGGTLQNTATTTIANLLRIVGAGATIDVASGSNLTASGASSGAGSLTKTGPGTLTLTGAGTYAGTTRVSEGTLAGAANLPARSSVTVDAGATLNYLNAAGAMGSLSGSGTVQASTASAVRIITIGNDGTNATFSGVLQAPGTASFMAITKVGAGTQTLQLSAASGYTGATIVNAGTLNLDFSTGGLNSMLAATPTTLGGGNLQVTGRDGSSTVSQTLGAFTVGAGGGKITMVPNGATATNLTTGAVTSTAAGGSLLVQAPANTTVKLGAALDTAVNGRIVFTDGLGNFNWAANAGSGTDTVALGTYSDVAGQTVSGTDTNNSRIASSVANEVTTVGSGGWTTSSLRIDAGAANQSLSLGANNVSLTSGGLLYTGAHDYAITGTGALNSGLGANSDLIVHHHGTGNLALNAAIGTGVGAQTFTKAGPGTVTLGGTNTYTGATFITGGTLSISANSLGATANSAVTIYDGATLQTTATMSLGTHPVTLAGGNATLDIAPSTSLTLGAAMTHSSAGTLTLNNTGTLVGGVNTFINSAVTMLQLGGAATVNMNNFTLTVGGISGAGTITNSGATATAFTFGGNNASTTFSGTMSGAINFTKQGTGVLTLDRAATYTGSTAVTNGGVVFGVNNALPATALVLANASGGNAFVDLNGFDWTSAGITFHGTSSAATSQATLFVGSGTLTLGGNIAVTPNATAANGFVGARLLGGRVDLGTTNRTFTVGESINAGVDLTISSVISSNAGNFGISKAGAGTLLLTGANTYAGTTTVNGASGTLLLGGAGTLGSGTNALTMTAGTLDLGGTHQNVGNLTGAGGVIQNSAAGTRSTLSVGNGSTATGTYSGTIVDAGGTVEVVKNGTGVTSLNGANTYSGGTMVNEGVLVFGTTVAKPASGTTQVAANAALGLGVGGVGTFTASDVDALFANTLPNVNLLAGSAVALDTAAGDFTYATNQSAPYGLVKLGANTLFLTGTNTYSGPTVLLAGNLEPAGLASLGNGSVIFNGGTLRWPAATPFDISSKTVSLLGAGVFDTNGNNVTLANSIGAGGAGALTKVGAGTLTLAGGTTHTGNTVVTGGILHVTGAVNNGTATTSLGSAAAARGMLWAGPGADYQTTTFSIGANATGAGSLVITGGNVATTTTNTAVGVNLGDAGYGGLFISAGSLSSHRFENNDAAGQTVMRVSGTGTLSSDEYIIFRNSRWEFTITGGQVLHNAATQNIALGYEGAGRTGAMTVAGGLVDNTGRNVSFGQNNAASVSSLNLNAGALITNAMTLGTGGAIGYLNFNGGTLRAAVDSTAFVPNLTASYVNGPFGSFTGGAVIDSAGRNVTIAAPMLAPTGDGVTSLALGTAGSGYIGAPYVEITGGGGTGATGYAEVDLDPESPTFGQVTGVVITNPGVNYTSAPTVNLLGGGGTGASVTSGIGANTSGGLLKTGAGTLTLSGTNTYTGATTVNGGTLSIAPTSIANSSAIVVGSTGSGALDLNQDGVAAPWNLAAGVNITLGGGPGVSGALGFQLGSNTSTSDRIVFGAGGALTINAGGGIINATSLGGFGVGSYDVISGATSITGDTNLRLGILPSGYQYSLTPSSNSVTLNVLSLTPAGDLYWTGDVNGSWSQAGTDTNWASNADGSGDGGNTPGASNLVHFSATTASASPIATTLDTAVSVQGVKFLNSGTGSVSIAPGIAGSLTVGADGIDLQAGAAAPVSISAPVTLGADQTWNVTDAASTLSVSGIVSGAANLIKAGAGTATLSGANTFTGNVTLNSGTLRVTTAGTTGLGTGAAALFLNGGELQIAESTARNLARNTTVGGNTTISVDRLAAGAGVSHTLGTLSIGSHTLTVNAGSLATSGTMGLVFATGTTLTGSPTFVVNNNGLGATTNLTLVPIDDAGNGYSITKAGDGTLTMPAAVAGSNFSGGLIIKAGVVGGGANANTFGTNGNLITLGDSTGSANATLSATSSQTYPQPILVAAGNTGVATIVAGTSTGSVIFSGPITLDNHDVVLTKTGTTGTSQFTGGIAGTGNVTINNVVTTTGVLNFSGIINPVGTITNTSTASGLTTISAAIGTNVTGINQNSATSQLTLTGVNSYSGPVTVNAGVLQLTRQQALFGGNVPSWTASNIVVQPGAALGLNVGGINEFTAADITALLGAGSATGGFMNGSTLRLDTAANFTYDGAIANPNGGANALGLTKLGAGTLTLTGAATYTGVTTIMAGALSGNIGTGNLVLNGGVFESSGTFTRSLGTGDGAVQWAAGANGGFAAKGGPLTVTLAGAPSLVWDSTPNFVSGAGQLLFGSTTADDVVTFTNNINLNDPGSAVTRTIQVLDNSGVTTDRTVFSGVISGGANATLAKTGAGMLELTGANTYAGPTTVSAGTLIVSSIGGSGVTSSNLGAGNATLSLGSGNTTGGTLTYTGSGETTNRPINLTAATTGGGTIISSGTGPLTWQGNVTNAGTTKNFVLSGDYTGSANTFSGVINLVNGANTGNLVKQGLGTWALGAPNSYVNTTVSAGTLRLIGPGTLGTGTVTVTTGALEIAGNVNPTVTTLTLGGGTGTSAAVQIGVGRALTATAITYTGTASNTGVISGLGTLNLGAAGLIVTVADNIANVVDLSWQMNGLTGSGTLTKAGAGTLDLRGIAANSFGGSYLLNAGALAGSTSLAGNINLNGGVFETSGTFSRSLGTGATEVQWTATGTGGGGFAASGGTLIVALSGAPEPLVWGGTTNFVPSGAPLIFGSTSANNTVDFTHGLNLNGAARTVQVIDNTTSTDDKAVLSGAITNGGLTKTGNGVLQLSGTNSGLTGITSNGTGGTLQFSTADNLGGASTPLVLQAGAFSFVGGASLTVTNPLSGDTGTASQSANVRTLAANGTGGAIVTFASPISLGLNTLTLAGASEGRLTGGFTQTGNTSADLVVSSGNWTVRDTNANISDDLLVNGGVLTLENMVLTINDDTVVTGGTLNLNSTGVLIANAATGVSSGLYARNGGVINLNAHDINGANNSSGLDFIILGDTTPSAPGTLNTNGFNLTTPRLDVGQVGDGLEGHVTGNGTITLTATTTDWGMGLRILRGSVAANLAGVSSIWKTGPGTGILSGDNSGLTGTVAATRVDTGTLILDYTTNNNSKISTVAALDLRGGTLNLVGNATADTAQTVTGLTLNNGNARISLQHGGAQNLTLNLGAITRNANGSIDFGLSANSSIATTSVNAFGSVLGGWATVNGNRFASVNAGQIVAATTIAKDDVSTWTTGDNVTDATGYFGTIGNASINSLVFESANSSTVTIEPANTLTIASGGILVAANSGAGTIAGGRLATNSNNLVVHQHNLSDEFTISSSLDRASSFTKAGVGTLVLSGNNNANSRPFYVGEGTVRAVGGNAIGDLSVLTLPAINGLNPVVDLSNMTERVGGLSGGLAASGGLGTVQLGATGTLIVDMSAGLSFVGVLSGGPDATFIKEGAGTLGVGAIRADFTGRVIINGGGIRLDGNTSNQDVFSLARSFSINGQGSHLISDQDQDENMGLILNTATISLANTSSSPAIAAPNGLAVIGTGLDGALVENMGPVTLQAGHSSIFANTAAEANAAVIITAGLGGLSRQDHATLLVAGQNLGVGSGVAHGRVTVTSATAASLGGIGAGGAAGTTSMTVIPYMVGAAAATATSETNLYLVSGDSLVTYDTAGLRPLNLTTEYEQLVAAGGVTVGNNVRFSSAADLTLNGTNKTMNSLVVDSPTAAIVLNGAGGSLNVQSGAFLFTGTSAATLSGFSGVTIGSGEYIFHVPSTAAAGVTVNAPLITPHAALVKSGNGILVLPSTASTYNGGTWFNQGLIEVPSISALGTGALHFSGGGLRWASGSTFDPSASGRALNFNAGGAYFDTNGNNVTIAGAIGNGGSGGLTKLGEGMLRIADAGVVNFTGGVTVAGGTTITSALIYGVNGALPATTSVTLGVHSALGGHFNIGSHLTTLAGLNINANSVITGSANLTFTGNVNAHGSASRTLTIDNLGLTTFDGNFLTIVDRGGTDRTLTLNGQGNIVINSEIINGADNGGLTYAGTGNLRLNSSNTYTGTTTLSSGSLSIGHDQALGTGALTVGSAAVSAVGGDRVLSDVTTFSLSNGATTVFNGDHSISITADNILFGNATSSTTVLTNNLAAGKTLTLDADGVMRSNRSDANRTLTVNGSGHTVFNATITDNPAATTRLTALNYTGTGTLEINAANTYTGNTTINNAAGTVIINNDQAFGLNNTLVLASGTLRGDGSGTRTLAQTVTHSTGTVIIGGSDKFIFNGPWTVSGGTRTLQVDTLGGVEINGPTLTAGEGTANRAQGLAGSGNILISSVIRDNPGATTAPLANTLQLQYTGTGTLTLTGANTNTGQTTINNTAATVNLSGAGRFGSGNLNVAAGTVNLNPALDQTVAALLMGGGAAGSLATLNIPTGRSLIAGGVTYSATNNNQTAVVTGPGTLDLGASGITVNIGNSSTVDVDMTWTMNTVSGSGLFIKDGLGTLDIRGVTNYNYAATAYQLNGGAILGLNVLNTNIILNGGVYEGSGTFSRSLGTGNDQIRWLGAGGGGFAANGAPFTVTIPGTPDPLVWGVTPDFVPDGAPLVFGSATATDVVTFTHNIDLNTSGSPVTRTITVNDNALSTADRAVLPGNLTQSGTGSVTLTKAGAGTLLLTGSNTFSGVTVTGGTLAFETVSDTDGVPSNLGQGLGGISLAGTLSFVGAANQATSRPITLTASSILDASGAGTITYSGPVSAAGFTVTLSGSGSGVLNGVITNSGTDADLNKTGAGTWQINAAQPTIPDNLVISEGTLIFNAANVFQGDDLFIRNATLKLTAAGAVTGSMDDLNVSTETASGGILDIAGTTGSTPTDLILGAAAFSGSVIDSVGTGSIGAVSTFNFRNGTVSASLTGATPLNKTTAGTVTLAGANTGFTGITTVSNGTLLLDYQTNNGEKLSNTGAGALTGGGGAVVIEGSDTQATLETLGGLTLTAGANQITVNNGTGQTATLDLKAITRAAGDGFANFNFSSPSASVLTTTANLSNSILSGWATVGGTNFATVNSGSIGAATSLVRDDLTAWAAGEDVTDSAGYFGTTGTAAINSLRFDTNAAPSTVTIAPNSILTIASGGILVTPNVGTALASITGGRLVSATGNELMVHQFNTQADFTIASSLAGVTRLTKGGDGVLILSGNNTNSGITSILSGEVRLSGGRAIGDFSPVSIDNVAGATLNLNDTTETIGNLSGAGANGGGVVIGTGALTIRQTATSTYTGSFAGSGTVTKMGAPTWTFDTDNNISSGFTGTFQVNQGQVTMSGAVGALPQVSAIVLNGPGSVLQLNNDQTTAVGSRLNDDVVVTLNNTAGGLGLSVSRNAGTTTGTETMGQLVLGAGHNTLAADGTATDRIGVLRFDGTTPLVRQNFSTALLVGRNLGVGSGQRGSIVFATDPGGAVGGAGAAGGSTLNIYPYLVGEVTAGAPTAANVGNSFVTMVDGTVGMRPLNLTTEYVVGQSNYDALGAGVLTNNVRFIEGTSTLDADTTGINALVLDSATGITVVGAAQSYQITSGAILSAGAGANTIAGFSGITTTSNRPYYAYVTNAAGSLAMNSPLTSTVILVKSGAGTLVLENTNNLFTDLYFNQGAVQADAMNKFGLGAFHFFGGALKFGGVFDPSLRTMTFSKGGATFDTNGFDIALAQSIGNGGEGSFTKTGAGTLTLNAPVNYAGSTIVSNGTLTYGVANALPATMNLTLGTTLNHGAFDATLRDFMLIASGTISGAGHLVFTGPAEIDGGAARTLTVNNASTTFDGETLTLVNTGTTARTTTLTGTGNVTINSAINDGSAAGALTITSSGVTTLAGANTYSNATTMNNAAGTLVLAGSNSSAGATTLTAGKIIFASGVNGGLASGLLTLTAGTLEASGGPRTISNNVTLTAVTVQGSEDLAINGTLTATGASNRTLTNNIGVGRTLSLNNVNISDNASSRVLILAGTGDTTIRGIIANGTATTGALQVTNSGVTILEGNNSYTGATTISAGLVRIRHDNALGTTANGTTVAAGASLELEGDISVPAEALSINGTGTVGANGALRNLSGTNNYAGLLTLTGPATIHSAGGNLNLTHTGTITGAGFNLTLTGAGNGSIASLIGTTSGSVIKTGAGAWTLSNGGSTFTGGVNVSEGTLVVGANSTPLSGTVTSGPLGRGTLTIGNATIQGTTGGAWTIGNAVVVGGDVTFGGSTANEGLTLTGAVDLGSATRTLTVSSAAVTTTVSGVMSGLAGLTKAGAGTLVLSGANSYDGDTTISAGTLRLGANDVLPNGAGKGNVSVGGTLDLAGRSDTINGLSGTGTIDNTTNASTSTLTIGATDANGTFAGTIQNTGSGASLALVKTGSGTLELSGTNTYGGGTTINGGTLVISADANLGDNSGALTFGGASTLSVTENLSASRAVNLNAAATVAVAANKTATVSGRISGSAGLTKDGTGTLVLANAATDAPNRNDYAGGTTLNSGTIEVTLNEQLGANTGGVTFAGASTLRAAGDLTSNRSFTLNAEGTFEVTSGKTLTLGATSELHGGQGMTKSGPGTLVVSSDNSTRFTGPTTIEAGTYVAANTSGSATGDGAVFVNAAGTLAGNGSISGAVTLDGTLAPGLSIGTLSTGALSFADGSTFELELEVATLTSDRVNITGNLSLAGTVTLTLDETGAPTVLNVGDRITLATYTGTWNGGLFTVPGFGSIGDWTNNETAQYFEKDGNLFSVDYNFDSDLGSSSNPLGVTLVVVPEPGSLASLAGAAGLLLGLQRFRRRRS